MDDCDTMSMSVEQANGVQLRMEQEQHHRQQQCAAPEAIRALNLINYRRNGGWHLLEKRKKFKIESLGSKKSSSATTPVRLYCEIIFNEISDGF